MTGTFPKRERILSSKEFGDCMDRARKVATPHFLVFVAKTRGPRRLGLILKRQVGNAVMRNRWKRKIREAFRLNKEGWLPACDIVVMVRRREAVPPYATIARELCAVLAHPR